jgi:hypothetical protein
MHEELLGTLVQHQLYRTLSVFRASPTPRIANYWLELHFTDFGIKEDNIYVIGEAACPDLLLLTQRPSHLVVVELKIRPTVRSLTDLRYQLRTDREYILDHGEELARFLQEEGLSHEEIGDLEIGFSGVVGLSSKRLREVQYFGLLDN